ncbi:hypothetical protein CBL_20327 [Carabus blaptoides fortunei]
MTLYEEYFTLKMVENDSVTTCVPKVTKLAAEIEDQGEKLSNNIKMPRIINSLLPRFQNLKTVWYKIKEGPDLNNLLSRLRQEEDQLNKNIDEDSAAFAVQKKQVPIADRRRLQNVTTVAEQGISAASVHKNKRKQTWTRKIRCVARHDKSRRMVSELIENLTERYVRVASKERLTICGQGLIRYKSTSKNYRLYDPIKNKVIVSCDVRFNEVDLAGTSLEAEGVQTFAFDGPTKEEIIEQQVQQNRINCEVDETTPEMFVETPEREERYNLRPFI